MNADKSVKWRWLVPALVFMAVAIGLAQPALANEHPLSRDEVKARWDYEAENQYEPQLIDGHCYSLPRFPTLDYTNADCSSGLTASMVIALVVFLSPLWVPGVIAIIVLASEARHKRRLQANPPPPPVSPLHELQESVRARYQQQQQTRAEQGSLPQEPDNQ